MNHTNLKDIDLYELIGILSTATTQEVKKAYRKKALSCHPDKNPDNPKAAELFHQLSKALEILTDESARAAYDRVLNAKKAAKLRHRELDSKRQKLKEQLEARERQAEEFSKQNRSFTSKTDEEKLQDEIERLRKEGSKQVKEEQEYVRQQIIQEKFSKPTMKEDSSSHHRLKVRWVAAKADPDNGGYTSELLHDIFSKYGEIVALIISAKRNGSALVEFKTKEAAVMAMELEQGLTKTPLRVEYLGSGQTKPPSAKKGLSLADLSSEKAGSHSSTFPSMDDGTENKFSSNFPSFSFSSNISVCNRISFVFAKNY
ncbi:DnaJ-like protein subfamily C member 17 [Zootermopsis nevadensis]|uniref:DnaJ homolog subfamily C member 17 n=1 Tax=Zootermopsis nevadensis TaxID=136037 RepID=A0A067R2E0_ZOONE|nr:DnaJ-like protein subfamily C member 17 [Zootermopsis nevadensis]